MAKYRKFLSDDVDSYIVVYAERQGSDIAANMKLADCDRNVNIDFSVWKYEGKKKAQINKRLAKLAVIEEGLKKIRVFLEEQRDQV